MVGILRGCPPEHVAAVGRAAFDAGLEVLEVTMDSPDPAGSLERLIAACPAGVIGAGTVRDVATLDQAADAGAAFIVTPVLSHPVVEAAVSRGLPCIPGAASPSEIWAAIEAGAAAVKVFPAKQLGGPGYIRAVVGPLGRPALIPVGEVGAADAAAYLRAGAAAVGVGGLLFPTDLLTRGDAAGVGALAAELMKSLP